MAKFFAYTIFGTLLTFAIILHFSLLPHLKQMPSFAGGVTPAAILAELPSFGFTLVLSWIAWWSVSGILALMLYSAGKYTAVALFFLSLAAVLGITILIT